MTNPYYDFFRRKAHRMRVETRWWFLNWGLGGG